MSSTEQYHLRYNPDAKTETKCETCGGSGEIEKECEECGHLKFSDCGDCNGYGHAAYQMYLDAGDTVLHCIDRIVRKP